MPEPQISIKVLQSKVKNCEKLKKALDELLLAVRTEKARLYVLEEAPKLENRKAIRVLVLGAVYIAEQYFVTGRIVDLSLQMEKLTKNIANNISKEKESEILDALLGLIKTLQEALKDYLSRQIYPLMRRLAKK